MKDYKTHESVRRAMARYLKTDRAKIVKRNYMRTYQQQRRKDPALRKQEEARRDRSGHCDFCGQWRKTLKRKSSPAICSTCNYRQKKQKKF